MKPQLIFFPRAQKGFSLAGAMIAMAAISIVVLIVANFSATSNRMFSDIDKNNAVTDVFTELRFTLENKAVCTENFKSLSFDSSDKSGTTVPKISSYRKTPAGAMVPATKIVENHQSLRGMRVKSLKLLPKFQLNSTLVLTELQATFEKDTSVAGEKGIQLVRSLPLLMRVQANKVEECWVRKPYGEMAYNTICTSATGGALDSIDTDPSTPPGDRGKCTLANGQWFQDSTSVASCPAGATLNEDADKKFNCRPVMPPGFKDPYPPVEVPSTDGKTIKMGRAAFVITLDKEAKTCHCNWATDVPPAALATFKCEILCLVPQ